MQKLPSYKLLKEHFPLSPSQYLFIENSRKTVKSILEGKDSRLLLIVGPCSIHDANSAYEYAKNLKKLSEEVKDQFFILMRAYCEKPRTASDWKGYLNDPFLDGTYQIAKGIEWTRALFLKITDLNIPIATEFLDPLTVKYFDDLVSWGSIGARTSSSQTHRQMASGLKMPIGMKNGVAGNISAAINAVLASTRSHSYVALNEEGNPCIVTTTGNPDSHVVLRGGENGPNYDPETISQTISYLQELQLQPKLIIDCSHHNSGKQYDVQPVVFQSVLEQFTQGNPLIRGLMVESHLFAGRQNLFDPALLRYGVSITDACLDWDSTKDLIQWGAMHLKKNLPAFQSLEL
ncbi:MAG: 3-deoxy-7-phosphoheptulonate synthase [Parachlamydiaceae bacterium]|nr:3-deoxy-7-phosphoheptulonate synthase [Parachlamydiaceae bacterium]